MKMLRVTLLVLLTIVTFDVANAATSSNFDRHSRDRRRDARWERRHHHARFDRHNHNPRDDHYGDDHRGH